MPGALGRHTVATIHVEYANTGEVSMPAPLLLLKSADPDNNERPILTLDQSRIIQDYWSASLPPGTGNQVLLLASGAQPGVLNPGERFQVPVYYLGLQQPVDFSDNQVEMEIRFWTAHDPTPIDWTARKESLRPPTLDTNTWNAVYLNLASPLTNTGAYVSMLDDNAQFLSRLGERVGDVDNLWMFELQQAYGYSAIPILDSAVDASMPAPGVSLDFARRFSSTLRARNSWGPFGYGWYSPWQAFVVVQNGGDLVQLVGEAGSARVFSRDTRNGGYFSGAGDSSQLTAIGGGIYELRDSNGIVTRFRANGRIDYVQDPNGNRVTAGYNGANQLTTLSHTSGASITLGYNGAGLIQIITDSAGGSVTYGYDPGNTYLQTATTDDNKVTSYTYETAGTTGQRSALTSVTRGGVTRHFTFDTSGRLQTTYLASGEQLISLGYDSAGGVTIADGQGTNRLYFDYRGLLAKTTDPLGNTTTVEFNDSFRLKRLIAPTGESQSFTWCDCGSLENFTDELGHTTTFQHNNPFKRLTGFVDARNNDTAYAYDSAGNLLPTTYPNSSVERFENYTPSGLPQKYTNRRNQSITYTYTPSGQVERQTFADGSHADFDYDARGNLTNVTEHVTDGDRLRQVTYSNGRWVAFAYDIFGRRQRIIDSTGQTNTYEYDGAGRLWKLRDATNGVQVEYAVFISSNLAISNQDLTYNYDAVGDRTSTVINGVSTTYVANNLNQYTSVGGVTYQYDSDGNLTFDGVRTYTYDTQRRLVSVSEPDVVTQYEYDVFGNRITTESKGQRIEFLLDPTGEGNVVAEHNRSGNLVAIGLRLS